MAVRARVCTTFQSGTDPDGTEVDIIDGSVTLDGTAAIRSTVDLTTDGTRRWPDAATDLLAPYGNELFIQRGIQISGSTTEWCSLGYMRIQAPSQAAPVDGPIRITGQDRMAGIIDGRLLAPVQYQDTATYGTIMSDLITEVFPSATIEWDDATDAEATGRQLLAEDDRYKFLNDLVTSLGKVWYWDHRGILVIKDVPDPDDPVFTVDAGAGGVLVSMSRELSREGVYNAVVASGEAADGQVPVTATAVDDNPDSPTYFSGRFGPVPQFYSSPFLTTVAQCESAAAAILRRNLGLSYSVDFTAVPNPALEPYDPVAVRANAREGARTHILQSVKVPLTAAGALSASTRDQTVVLIGLS
jgi:hypothetical protein